MAVGDRIAVAALAAALVAVGLGAWLLVAGGAAAEPAVDELLDPFGSAGVPRSPLRCRTWSSSTSRAQ